MIVALSTADAEAEPDGAGGGHAVEDAVDPELFLVDAALLIDLRVAMKAGGDDLALAGLRQEIAGELLDGELVEGHVRIERIDHPVAEFPNLARRVDGVAVRVRVTRLIQPPAAPAFAIVLAGEQAVHERTIFGIRPVGGV